MTSKQKNRKTQVPINTDSQLENKQILLPPTIRKAIDELKIQDPEKRKISSAIVTELKQSFFSGPIPPPDILREYNDILPNGADRIVSMAENQSKHRMDLENTAVKEQLSQSKRGQTIGFILALVGIGSAVFLSYTGHEYVAGILAGTTIISLVTVFVLGKRAQQKNLDSKK